MKNDVLKLKRVSLETRFSETVYEISRNLTDYCETWYVSLV